jgi:hypothetical protein
LLEEVLNLVLAIWEAAVAAVLTLTQQVVVLVDPVLLLYITQVHK